VLSLSFLGDLVLLLLVLFILRLLAMRFFLALPVPISSILLLFFLLPGSFYSLRLSLLFLDLPQLLSLIFKLLLLFLNLSLLLSLSIVLPLLNLLLLGILLPLHLRLALLALILRLSPILLNLLLLPLHLRLLPVVLLPLHSYFLGLSLRPGSIALHAPGSVSLPVLIVMPLFPVAL